MSIMRVLFLLLAIPAVHAAPLPEQAVLPLAELQASGGSRLVQSAAFAPKAGAMRAHEPFVGMIEIPETPMTITPGVLKTANPLDRKPELFPAVELKFFSDGDELVPYTEEVILSGSAGRGKSYWDLIVQPGALWSEPADEGWSRGGFPFALVNALEGESHNGVATFAYRHGRISRLRLQVVQETAPFYVESYFTATAQIAVRPHTVDPREARRLQSKHHAVLAAQRPSERVPVAPWSDLERRVGADVLRNFDDGKSADIVASGLDYDGTLYLKPCDTIAGPLPWCDRARFGVWSATKSLVNEVALLRLAQKYGPTVFAARIVDFVPQARRVAGWATVTFGNAINMATGMGNGKPKQRRDILDGTLDNYGPWYEARSLNDKVGAILRAASPYPWKPGEVARYRDQDMFLVGVAMDAYLKKRAGPTHSLWSMLTHEVYEPIGIRTLAITKTLQGAADGQPLMAYGLFATLPDIVRIARLYQNRGAFDGRQILYAPRIEELLTPRAAPGLPTGRTYPSGETYYFNAFWETAYRSPATPSGPGCEFHYPQMEGWGGTEVALFPNRLTAIRIAKIWEDGGNGASDTSGMARAVERIEPFCH